VSSTAVRARPHPRPRERCPACGIPSARGQLICLSCGNRLALQRKPSSWRVAGPLIAAMAIVALATTVLVIEGLGGEEAGTRDAPEHAAPRPDPAPVLARRRAEAAERASREKARRALAGRRAVWPAGRSGYTVVLVNAGDRQSAARTAADLRAQGVDAGVLSSDEHPILGTNMQLVYSGVYETQAEASAALAELSARFPGAFVRFVPPEQGDQGTGLGNQGTQSGQVDQRLQGNQGSP
jgi:SPOR domain